jgi:hypothetical protein
MAATTVALSSAAYHQTSKPFSAGLVGVQMTQPIATTSLDDVGDTVEMGVLPGNCAVVGFVIQSTSLAASALVYKIQIDGSDVVTTLSTGGAGASAGALVIIPGAPLALGGGPHKVAIVITTVATTPAAGTFNLTPLYINL